jgi:hypothetical protein
VIAFRLGHVFVSVVVFHGTRSPCCRSFSNPRTAMKRDENRCFSGFAVWRIATAESFRYVFS